MTERDAGVGLAPPAERPARRVEENLGALADKPVLVCGPGRDPAFKEKTLALCRDRFPQAEVHELEDAGHYVQEDAHEHVVPLLLDFPRRT